MEFACGFVYVPPSLTQKDGQRHNVIKRSALLPPVNWIRPSSPPPPPPKSITPQKTALLPPHMRSSANSQSPPHSQPLVSSNANSHLSSLTYDLPNEPDLDLRSSDPNYWYATPEGIGLKLPAGTSKYGGIDGLSSQFYSVLSSPSVPPLPPRPSFMKLIPEYLVLLPQKSLTDTSLVPSPTKSADQGPLPGNPNVLLVSLGKLLSEERAQTTQGELTSCSKCRSVLDPAPCYDNVVNECYFCQPWEPTSTPSMPQCHQDVLLLLCPDEKPRCAADALLLFCIDVSGSMSITSEVSEGELVVLKTRLQFVLEAVLHCVQRLSEQQPDIRVGLITFNSQVTMHGNENFTSHSLSGAELTDCNFLKMTAAGFPTPPPLSQNKDYLRKQVMGLCHGGTTALGPAALLTIAIASRQPGSTVIICTDGKANTDLGNLEVEDARTLLSSTIFYKDLGDYAANQGVTVSVLSIEGTDSRLDELGRLADHTGGKVVIASPKRLHAEFEEIIENRMIATQCTVTLLLPRSLRMRGEKEAGHKGTREVGNVDPHTEITFQFGASEQNTDVSAPASGSRVLIQLQIRYRQRKGQTMLRVITTGRDVTDDSSAALSSLSLAIVQLNSSQASAALAVRGRFLDARREGELQKKLIERAIEHNHSAEDQQTYEEWIKTMEPIYSHKHTIIRRKSVVSDSESLTDAGAVLFYTMKRSNRMTISLKNKHKL
ncbi:circularly permutated Ras protein 1-like [Lycodopsis pacificus]